jgi:polar amino acid transport system substrate-binding protein
MMPGISDVTAYFGMAFRKEDTTLHAFFNEQLAGMKQDGSLDKLQQKWFGATMPTPNTIPDVLP